MKKGAKKEPKGRAKIIIVLGPTASGKSALAVYLAKKFNGEIISADSRQVYKGLDIGTGKITKKEMLGITHHMLDIAHPSRRYSVSRYKKGADKRIKEIIDKGKLPIVCGGTGFYIQAIVEGLVLPEVKPNKKLRQELNKKSTDQLFKILQKLDSRRSKEIDSKNPRRLVRAIEIAMAIKKVPKIVRREEYNTLEIGISTKMEILKKKINKRLLYRMKKGMIAESRHIRQKGLSWKRFDELGLEYRYIGKYLQRKISKKEMLDELNKEIINYAKRQMTWFKRDHKIHWVQTKKEATSLTKNFLE